MDRAQSSCGVRPSSVKVVGGVEKRRGDDAEDERFMGFMPASTSRGQRPSVQGRCEDSAVVKSAGPRADGSGSYSGNTAFRACGFGQVA